jgi:hypothetical protein
MHSGSALNSAEADTHNHAADALVPMVACWTARSSRVMRIFARK